jgi:hypothetical protein
LLFARGPLFLAGSLLGFAFFCRDTLCFRGLPFGFGFGLPLGLGFRCALLRLLCKPTLADFALPLWFLLRLDRRRGGVVETPATTVEEKRHKATPDQYREKDSNS